MGTRTWNKARATKRIDAKISALPLKDIEIKDYVRDTDLSAKVRVGIDTGKALAVNNGRRGHREPLFLGEPANHAAKRAGGGTVAGIYLTNKARKAIGLKEAVNVDTTPLGASEIETSQK